MYHFIKSIKKNDMVNFKDFLENLQFYYDDINLLVKESLQEFFHTFNSLMIKAQIIIFPDCAPAKLERVQDN